MNKPTTEAVASRLLAGGFAPPSSQPARLADPIKETPMLLTLDQLSPYDNNPRKTRNPNYDDIKASILARGLDQPPPVTRRPGEDTYIISSGGNTRLAILNELWQETHEERFFRINCLFRPWSDRGEIVALTGHLAENDMRGNLMFIERAVGIEQARQLYTEQLGRDISQRELARLLKEDGYSISNSHISRMQETLRTLVPAIPALLYSGLGKPQVEKLLTLRSSALNAWIKFKGTEDDFEWLYQEVLNGFDGPTENFVYESVEDALIGRIGMVLEVDYEHVLKEVLDHQKSSRRAQLVGMPIEEGRAPEIPPSTVTLPGTTKPTTPEVDPAPASKQRMAAQQEKPASGAPPHQLPQTPQQTGTVAVDPTPPENGREPPVLLTPPDPESLTDDELTARLDGHIVTPDGIGPKVREVQRRIAAESGETLPDFNSDALRAIPVQAGGLHPVSDLWYIERVLDNPDDLRRALQALAFEVAELSDVPGDLLYPSELALGFTLKSPQAPLSERGQCAWQLLQALYGMYGYVKSRDPSLDLTDANATLALGLGRLLIGDPLFDDRPASTVGRMTDAALVKLFRMIRLARRLIELEAGQ
ncbi:ParB family protein [Pseudomonas oryzihabitans]|uniref:ParB family protein n=1 Tax=Pseudomonas oryzihabitans TaxID=47885 RepID=UPI00286302B3|nr:ParB family protein [Pseudomonas psychrotolerans]MDR6675822.1 ParB family protein of integrating conjugative element (PFGI_1 class) [Pseudomonas psychrotolerans]